MKFSLYIARRYLFSRKSHNVINIISGIAMVGVGVGTLALIVVLSAFNGLEELVETLYSSFDPEIRITAVKGKSFDRNAIPREQILDLAGVSHYSNVIEETVFLEHGQRQTIATMKGVEEQFLRKSGLDSMLIDGTLALEYEELDYAILGWGVANNLSVFLGTSLQPIQAFAAKRGSLRSANPQNKFTRLPINPGGIFSINPDFDASYMVVPLSFASDLLEYENAVTAVEVGLTEGTDMEAIKRQLQPLLGPEFKVETRYDLNEVIYKTNRSEKWITYLILTFILVIATFNVIGSLTMLILDKKEDVRILQSMGANRQQVRNIFLLEGLLITMIGCLAGLVLGSLLILAQQFLGLVRLQDAIVDFYPVKLELLDFGAILLTVLVIGVLASWFPVKFATRKFFVAQ